VIFLGAVLIVAGLLVPKLAVLVTIGVIVLAAGLLLLLAGASGHAVGGQRLHFR
jgi:membrane-bound ClpP family serine protease